MVSEGVNIGSRPGRAFTILHIIRSVQISFVLQNCFSAVDWEISLSHIWWLYITFTKYSNEEDTLHILSLHWGVYSGTLLMDTLRCGRIWYNGHLQRPNYVKCVLIAHVVKGTSVKRCIISILHSYKLEFWTFNKTRQKINHKLMRLLTTQCKLGGNLMRQNMQSS